MKVFVTGVAGQLGHDVMNALHQKGHMAVGSDLAPLYSGIQDGTPAAILPYVPMDITDETRVMEILQKEKPDAVIHCAAWTAVDLAEDADKEALVYAVNGGGTRNIAAACKVLGCKMVYLSTDYVFDGEGETPWTPDQQNYAPLNVYGKSKLAGEQAVTELLEKYFIVRIAWVFGRNGSNFVKTMLRLSEKYDSLRVVCDQIGTPTYTKDLAQLLVEMIETEKYGRYHATNEGGFISWYDFACEIFRQAGRQVQVTPVTTREYGLSKAKRPHNSRLDKTKLVQNGFTPLPVWQDALARYLKEMGE